jgi:hypothetical protein
VKSLQHGYELGIDVGLRGFSREERRFIILVVIIPPSQALSIYECYVEGGLRGLTEPELKKA